MTNSEILSHIDHTLLRQDARWEEIEQLCQEAEQYHTASVCIPPCFVKRVREKFSSLNICTVAGFPLGYQNATVKAFETAMAVTDGADEVDLVINVCALKEHNDSLILKELSAARHACKDKILKVILETCLLNEREKIHICGLVTECGADYVKTSTGFGSAGADLKDIPLLRQNISVTMKIKAAGGIQTKEQMEAFLKAGCERIGTSHANILFTPE